MTPTPIQRAYLDPEGGLVADLNRWTAFTTRELQLTESALDAYDDFYGLQQEARQVRDEITTELQRRQP